MITWRYIEPIRDPMSVAEFEADFGVQLPAAYKELVRQYNNARPSPACLPLPNDDICKVKLLYSFNREDPENMWRFNSAENLEAGYVAFACDGFGNQFGFRLSDHAIVFADHDADELWVLAGDLETFLNSLATEDELE